MDEKNRADIQKIVEEETKKNVQKIVDERIRISLKTDMFTQRKLTDTPTDSLQVVNRKYVNMNGVTGSRPRSSILGQFYFDTTLGYPVWWNGTTWVKYDGTSA